MGTAFAEWCWRYRHWSHGRNALPAPQQAAEHYHRRQIVDATRRFYPFDSLLEVGCNTGANLYLLADAYPGSSFHGVDINAHSVKAGRRWFQDQGVPRVTFSVASAGDLRNLPDSSFDLALTDAVLMFVGPEKITRALAELRRVSRRGIILNEYASPHPPKDNYDGGRFVYDYWKLLPQAWPECKVEAEKSAFVGGGWDEYGWLFTVRL